jgi:hypothetical protein
MNVSETLAIIEALKASGATYFKSQDFEIRIEPSSKKESIAKPKPQEEKSEAEVSASKKIADMINTINMSPEDLANQIFPDGAL